MSVLPIDPILSCKDSLAFEANYFAGDIEKEWQAMNLAGEGIGDSLLRDMRELRTIPHRPRLLVLAGKGHNGGDALVAAKRFLKTIPTAKAVLWPYCSWSSVRPLCKRAYDELVEFAGKRIVEVKEVEGFADQFEIESKFLELFEKGEFAASSSSLSTAESTAIAVTGASVGILTLIAVAVFAYQRIIKTQDQGLVSSPINHDENASEI